MQRLIKYFPELCDSDEYITEFTVKPQRTDNFKAPLDPDAVKFIHPDFGFNDYMSFDDMIS